MQNKNGFEITKVKELSNSAAAQWLCKVSPPVKYPSYPDDTLLTTEYIVVSASLIANETYIFPSDKYGKVLNWSELPGSFQGALDHLRAISNLNHGELY